MRIFVLTIVVLGLLGVVYIYSGLFNVAADSKDSPVLDWVLNTTSERSIEKRAGTITIPSGMNAISVEEGFKHYREMCEKCHGGPGVKPTELNKGLNPRPPDLHRKSEDLSVAVIFWVVKHGIKMSAMPAFGKSREDQELLPAVAFVTRLPDISEAEYRALTRKESGKGR